ncbi:MAG: phosphatase PAP2 family protein [Erysipelotrichaceae bacterium]|nr:phosphatase PAP2 family protein [Erysipelotrichaceae bacterium]
MKENEKRIVTTGIVYIVAFIIWTMLIQIVDVQAIGPNGTGVGFATWNSWFHGLTGVHMVIYHITDWLGLVPIFVCMGFGCVGLMQLIKRRSLLKVDYDIMLLGIYYVVVIAGYLVFEMIPINYRPILIEGRLEASYPSSTTLLVLCVMPTVVFQSRRRIHHRITIHMIKIMTALFSVMMVMCRLISGVHWLSDIVGACLLSYSLYSLYCAAVKYCDKKE